MEGISLFCRTAKLINLQAIVHYDHVSHCLDSTIVVRPAYWKGNGCAIHPRGLVLKNERSSDSVVVSTSGFEPENGGSSPLRNLYCNLAR